MITLFVVAFVLLTMPIPAAWMPWLWVAIIWDLFWLIFGVLLFVVRLIFKLKG